MNFMEMLQGIGVYYSAFIIIILLLFRTITSLIVYKMLGQWCSTSFIEGLFKQMVLYALVLVSLGVMYIITRTTLVNEVLGIIMTIYYSILALVLTYTVGKLTILVKYAIGQSNDLDDFINGEEEGEK